MDDNSRPPAPLDHTLDSILAVVARHPAAALLSLLRILKQYAAKMDVKSRYFGILGVDAHRYVVSIAPFLLGLYLVLRLAREYVYRKSQGAASNAGAAGRVVAEEEEGEEEEGDEEDGEEEGYTESEQTPELEARELSIAIKLEPDLGPGPESILKHYHIETWEDARRSLSAAAVSALETKTKTVDPK